MSTEYFMIEMGSMKETNADELTIVFRIKNCFKNKEKTIKKVNELLMEELYG